MTSTIILALITAVALSAAFFVYHKVSGALQKMDEMLDAAIDGSFAEHDFSEQQLSKLESKMYRYLSKQEAQKRALETERENINRLIGDISHQTQTPLANVLLYTQLLAESEALGAHERELAGKTAVQAEKLSFLIASLVKTSRLENHVIQLRPQRGDIGQLLAELYETYAGKAAAAGRTLELVQPEHAFSARFDRKWTLEAVVNLIDNAIKYT